MFGSCESSCSKPCPVCVCPHLQPQEGLLGGARRLVTRAPHHNQAAHQRESYPSQVWVRLFLRPLHTETRKAQNVAGSNQLSVFCPRVHALGAPAYLDYSRTGGKVRVFLHPYPHQSCSARRLCACCTCSQLASSRALNFDG